MGSFSIRIFARLNFENVTGIGLHTSFEEMTYSYSLLQVSSLRSIFDCTSFAKCLRNTSRLNMSVILLYSDSVRNLPLFFRSESFSLIILS